MPTFRVTYRPVAGCRWLLEDIDADHHRVRGNLHVLARVQLVIGQPRWVCALRVPTAAAMIEGPFTALRVHDREVAAGGVALVAGRVGAACQRREHD